MYFCPSNTASLDLVSKQTHVSSDFFFFFSFTSHLSSGLEEQRDAHNLRTRTRTRTVADVLSNAHLFFRSVGGTMT